MISFILFPEFIQVRPEQIPPVAALAGNLLDKTGIKAVHKVAGRLGAQIADLLHIFNLHHRVPEKVLQQVQRRAGPPASFFPDHRIQVAFELQHRM